MSETETFFERTLTNLTGLWRDIAQSAARMRAAELGKTYLELDGAGKRRFLEILAGEFTVDEAALNAAIADYQGADEPDAKLAAEQNLRQASIP